MHTPPSPQSEETFQRLRLLAEIAAQSALAVTPPTPKPSTHDSKAPLLNQSATSSTAASASSLSRKATTLRFLELLPTVARSVNDTTPPSFIHSAHIGDTPNQYFYLELLDDDAVVRVIALRDSHTEPYFFEEYSIDQAPPIVRECIAKHHEDRLKQEETRYQRDESCDGATASAPPESSELRPMDVDEPESKPKRVPPPRLISPPSDGASSKHQRAQSMERQAPVKKASGKKSIASRKAGHKPPRKSSQRKTGQSPEVAIVSGNHYLGDPWRALLEKIFEDITPEPPLNWRNFLAYINSPESKVWNWFANRRQNYKGIRDTKAWLSTTSACGQKMRQWDTGDRKIWSDEEFRRVVEEEYIPVLPQIVEAHKVLRSLDDARWKGFDGRGKKKPQVK